MKNEPLPPKLAFACPKRWETMRPDGAQKLFCEHCQLHVHDLSSMSKVEGERFLALNRGRACVSYEQRRDGSMVTWTRWSRWEGGWNRARRAVFALLAVLTPFSFAACSSNRDITGRTGGSTCVSSTDGKDMPPDSGDPNRLTGRTNTPKAR